MYRGTAAVGLISCSTDLGDVSGTPRGKNRPLLAKTFCRVCGKLAKYSLGVIFVSTSFLTTLRIVFGGIAGSVAKFVFNLILGAISCSSEEVFFLSSAVLVVVGSFLLSVGVSAADLVTGVSSVVTVSASLPQSSSSPVKIRKLLKIFFKITQLSTCYNF